MPSWLFRSRPGQRLYRAAPEICVRRGDHPRKPCVSAAQQPRQHIVARGRSAASEQAAGGYGAPVDDPDGVYDVEAHDNYRRWDMAAVHAYNARRTFVECIQGGEAHADLARAALAISAEDDALVTHSTVAFPIDAFRKRINKLANECSSQVIDKLPPDSSPEDVVTAVEGFLRGRTFRLPDTGGRSALPQNAVVDHVGVWEDARDAYLNELLIRKRGNSSTICILLAEIMKQLFLKDAIDFAVKIDCRSFGEFPRCVPLPFPKSMLLLPDGGMLNTCTSDALIEMLRHLKRAFWPFAWDTGLDPPWDGGVGSAGGFRAAASEAIEGPVNAQIQAIARTAKHRLERGVWTSPGAGDIRRSLAACERLVMLCGAQAPGERRDLGVLYMFRGMPERAKVELLAYTATEHAREADAAEQRLVGGLLDILKDIEIPSDEEQPMSIEYYLGLPPPDPDQTRLPLTW